MKIMELRFSLPRLALKKLGLLMLMCCAEAVKKSTFSI